MGPGVGWTKMRRLPLAVSLTMVSRDPKGNHLSRHMVVPIKAEPYDMRYNFMSPARTRGTTR